VESLSAPPSPAVAPRQPPSALGVPALEPAPVLYPVGPPVLPPPAPNHASAHSPPAALLWTLPRLTEVPHEGSEHYRRDPAGFKTTFGKTVWHDYDHVGSGPKDAALMLMSSFPAGKTDGAVHQLLRLAGWDPEKFYDMCLVEGPRAKPGHYLQGMLFQNNSHHYSVVLGSLTGDGNSPRSSSHLRLVLKPTKIADQYAVEILTGQNWHSFGLSGQWHAVDAGVPADALRTFLEGHLQRLADALKRKLEQTTGQKKQTSKRGKEEDRLAAEGLNGEMMQLASKRRQGSAEKLQGFISSTQQRTGFHERTRDPETATPKKKKKKKKPMKASKAAPAVAASTYAPAPSRPVPGSQALYDAKIMFDEGGNVRLVSPPISWKQNSN